MEGTYHRQVYSAPGAVCVGCMYSGVLGVHLVQEGSGPISDGVTGHMYYAGHVCIGSRQS